VRRDRGVRREERLARIEDRLGKKKKSLGCTERRGGKKRAWTAWSV
jgi:hypothetical protein